MSRELPEYAARRQALAAELERNRVDSLVISSAPNVRYLTGFTGSNGALLLSANGALLVTDPRYQLQAAQEAGCRVRVARGALLPLIMKAAARQKLRRVGFEKGRLSFQQYEELREAAPLGTALEPVAGLVERVRMVKSEQEIALIRAAVLTNSRAYQKAMRRVRPGMRESELAAEIDYQMRLAGADKPAFDTIVASGPRTALPHAQPTGNRLANNQLVLIDVGAQQGGYASDMTRMAFLGRPPARVRRLYNAVLEAQLAGIAAVRAGVRAGQVDRAARCALRSRELDRVFVHSTGHGLGLEIHEPPRVGKRDRTPLAAGMVITIEPGAYVEGWGGVRIEDTVVVTATGCEVLTPTAKELLVL